MLILNETNIEQCTDNQGVISAVKEAVLMYESGDFYMPNRSHIDYKGNTLLSMPSFSNEFFGTKLVSVFPNNKQQNLPAIFGSMLLNDARNGKPLAMINGSVLTAHRTAALGALAAIHIVKSSTPVLGIIGAGVQSLHQAIYISKALNINTIYVSDISTERMLDWKDKLEQKGFVCEIIIAENVEELVQKSELIVTATTSETPVFEVNKEILAGKKILAFGSYKPSMRELPDSVFQLNPKLFIDTKHAIEESGDLASPISRNLIQKNEIHTLGKLINNQIKIADNELVVFKSVGMALFDLIVAKYIYQQAQIKNIGTFVEF